MENLLSKAVLRILQKNRVPGSLGIAEQIMQAVDMFGGDEGMAEAPRELQRELGWDVRANREEPAAPEKLRPAPPPQSAIIMPGDPEFREATQPRLEKSETGHVIKAPEVRLRPHQRPGSNSVERQYWDMGELQRAIIEHAPPRIDFTVEKDGQPVPLYALQNVMCQHGLGNVLLTYKHPSVSTDTGSPGNPNMPVNIPLIAQFPFSVYQEKVDIEEALHGPKGIVRQLKGMYSPRPKTMVPRVMDPGPLRIEDAYEGAEEKGRFQAGFDPSPGHSPATDNYQLESVRRSMKKTHDQLAPPGQRFPT